MHVVRGRPSEVLEQGSAMSSAINRMLFSRLTAIARAGPGKEWTADGKSRIRPFSPTAQTRSVSAPQMLFIRGSTPTTERSPVTAESQAGLQPLAFPCMV